jgi:iron complex transport system substrate-binding protein
MTPERICSLMPSATEIVCALGLADRLVAVTHECDFPAEALVKPKVTSNAFDSSSMTGQEIDSAVRASLADAATIYHLDSDLLQHLRPDLVLTQELCEVCAVGPEEVQSVMRSLPVPPRMVSLEPTTLDEVLDSIVHVGALAGVEDRASFLVSSLRDRVSRVRHSVEGFDRVSVLTLEWIAPVFAGGHWVPEMVQIAGGEDVLGVAGRPSQQFTWEDVLATDPDLIVAMPCGFDLERSLLEMRQTSFPDPWYDLRAVKSGQAYVVDGSAYFNRPGPRLIDGVEILASILHPECGLQTPPGSWTRFISKEERTGSIAQVHLR